MRLRRSPFVAVLVLVAAALAVPPSAALAQPAPGSPFAVGYNQAWIDQSFGRDLTASFDPAAVERLMRTVRDSGGSVVRLWAFEGRQKEGCVFQDRYTRTIGLEPGFLDHVAAVNDSARRHGVKVYWTVFDGNWFWDRGDRWAFIHYNILNDRFGETGDFERAALGPFLDVLARYPDVVYALDLMNEVEGSMHHWFWPDGWEGARRWVRREAAFAHARLPWLRVTASAGWHTAVDDLTARRFSGLGLDFYDLHLYNDTGAIPRAASLRYLSASTRRPIVLGEFGQAREARDDALQARTTRAFLANARAAGFAGALAWRLDDYRPYDPTWTHRHSYLIGGRPRPAVAEMRRFAASPGVR